MRLATLWYNHGKRSEANGGPEDIEQNLQRFQCRFDIGKFEENGFVRDPLIIEQEADTPNYWREADVLGAGQVVKHYLWIGLGGHLQLRSICFSQKECLVTFFATSALDLDTICCWSWVLP